MSTLDERAQFITDFARRLYLAGVSAARFEGAVMSTARSIGVDCQIWSSPTGILLSIGEAGNPRATQHTRVPRLDPAEPDLSDLATVDAIAEDVIAGPIEITDASRRLSALEQAPSRAQHGWTVMAFGLASAAFLDCCEPDGSTLASRERSDSSSA